MLIPFVVFFPFFGAVLTALIGRKNERAGDCLAAAVCAAEFLPAILLLFRGGEFRIGGVMAYGISFTTDGFRCVYAVIAAFMWLFTTLFGLEYFKEEREHLIRWWFFVLLTLGATEGVMLSADLMTTFLFFEILSFTSFTWVIHEETREAISAGYTYLFIAVIGGLVLFMGMLLLKAALGTLSFDLMDTAVRERGITKEVFAGGICVLFGFGAKAGMFPLHIWLPKAHPVAPSPGSALLSGILTKVGIYGILMTTMHVFSKNTGYGMLVLLLGEITMFLGALLALFSVNLKRTLACSSMSQIGFILTGTGMYVLLTAAGSEEGAGTALSGLMLHMVNHSLIKLTLFMAAGAVVMRIHSLTLDEIRGYGRNKPFLKAAFALGALGISGVPLFNGYISKTLLHEGIVEGIHECAAYASLLRVSEWVFLISGGFTFAYMLKLFICLFVEKNSDAVRQKEFDRERRSMNVLSCAVVFGSSLLMIVLGQPAVMKKLAAFMTGSEAISEFSAFAIGNLKGGLISLGIGAAVYLFAVRNIFIRKGSYVNLWPEKLDLEFLVMRPLLVKILPGIFGTVLSVFGENKLLTPLARAAVFLGTFAGRVLADSTDAVILFFRKTIFKERKAAAPKTDLPGFWWTIRESTAETIGLLAQNFSFALLMTCIGILLILGGLVFMMLFHS